MMPSSAGGRRNAMNEGDIGWEDDIVAHRLGLLYPVFRLNEPSFQVLPQAIESFTDRDQ
jgi:hypothetical protein